MTRLEIGDYVVESDSRQWIVNQWVEVEKREAKTNKLTGETVRELRPIGYYSRLGPALVLGVLEGKLKAKERTSVSEMVGFIAAAQAEIMALGDRIEDGAEAHA